MRNLHIHFTVHLVVFTHGVAKYSNTFVFVHVLCFFSTSKIIFVKSKERKKRAQRMSLHHMRKKVRIRRGKNIETGFDMNHHRTSEYMIHGFEQKKQ